MQLGIKSLSILEACLFLYSQSKKTIILGLVWIEGEGVEGSRIELTKNKLILGQIYFTLSQSKQTISSFTIELS